MIDLNNLSLEQAKALAFDEITKIEIAQKNLQVLNQVIQKRTQEAQQQAGKEDEAAAKALEQVNAVKPEGKKKAG